MVKTVDMERDRNSPTPENEDKELYVDEKTREKIRKHYSDPNDEITDADIANVNTDMYARPTTDDEKETLEEKADDLTGNKTPSSWDIQSE